MQAKRLRSNLLEVTRRVRKAGRPPLVELGRSRGPVRRSRDRRVLSLGSREVYVHNYVFSNLRP